MEDYKKQALSAVRNAGLAPDKNGNAISVNEKSRSGADPLARMETALVNADLGAWKEARSDWSATHKENELPVLKNIVAKGKTFKDFQFDQVILDNCKFLKCDISNLEITHSKLQNNTQFDDCSFNNLMIRSSILDHAHISGDFTHAVIKESVLSHSCIDATFHNDKDGNGNSIYYNKAIFCSDITINVDKNQDLNQALTNGGVQFSNNADVHGIKIYARNANWQIEPPIPADLNNKMTPDNACPVLAGTYDKMLNYPVTTAKDQAREARSEREFLSSANLQNITIVKAGFAPGIGGKGFQAELAMPIYRTFKNDGGFIAYQLGIDADSHATDKSLLTIASAKFTASTTVGHNINGEPAAVVSGRLSANSIDIGEPEVAGAKVSAFGVGVSAKKYFGNFGATAGVDVYPMNKTTDHAFHNMTINAKTLVMPSLKAEYTFGSNSIIHAYAEVAAPLTKSSFEDPVTHATTPVMHGLNSTIGITAVVPGGRSRR